MPVDTKSNNLAKPFARALWLEAARTPHFRDMAMPQPGPGQARIAALWSGISRGTERLIFEGRVPASERQRMRAPLQEGEFSFPLKYGYCAVGRVESGPAEWLGKIVFCLHPHQDHFAAPLAMLFPLPEGLPPRRAPLAANMETALNGIWDSGAAPGDKIIVVGAGLLGLLIAALAAQIPGTDVTIVDTELARASVAAFLGLRFLEASELAATAQEDADVVFHTSANPAGLSLALACAGMEAALVELSWYGDTLVPVALGGGFHAKRLRIISSQVGQVSVQHRPRWSLARRLGKALELLRDDRFDALITEEIRFEDLAREMPRILAPGARGLATIVRY